MESTKQENTKPTKNVYVLIEYNNDDNHDAYVVDVYSTAQSARNALMSLIKRDFNECEDYSNEDSDDSEEENINESTPGFDKSNWEHVKPLIDKELDQYREGYWEFYNKYSYLNYKVIKSPVKSSIGLFFSRIWCEKSKYVLIFLWKQ